jgi:AcrR family transcriptional regulator
MSEIPAPPHSTEEKRLRHPINGGYPRGEETRQRIIEASIAVFGERGFAGATTREIAQRAGVNTPALQYYFENKDGLYQACAQTIVSESNARFQPVADQVMAGLDAGAQGPEAIELFCILQDSVIDHMLDSRNLQSRRLFMAREQSEHAPQQGPAATRKQVVGQLLNRCGCQVLARISGEPADSAEARLKVMMMFGQALVFHVARPAALAALGWSDLQAEQLALIKRTLREQTRLLLQGYSS